MDNLFIVCKLVNIPKIVVVPINFIFELDLVKSLNYRLNRNQTHLMFWSSDHTKNPNFDLDISHRFEHNVDACFNIKILKAFDNLKKALEYRQKRRKTADNAVYNERRLFEKPYPKTKSRSNVLSIAERTDVVVQSGAINNSFDDIGWNDVGNALTPPNSPVPEPTSPAPANLEANSDASMTNKGSDNHTPVHSSEDIICLTKHIRGHRPFSTFDEISGRHQFTRTVLHRLFKYIKQISQYKMHFYRNVPAEFTLQMGRHSS